MIRVGWLVDEVDVVGGAELTQAEFAAAAPAGVEIVKCSPGAVVKGCDTYVIHNCVQYDLKDLRRLDGRPVVKFWHDVGPWVSDHVKEWIAGNATQLVCSPLQAQYMGIDATAIPPPIDLKRFEDAAVSVNGSRAGNVCVASWANYGKAPHKVAEWARNNGPVEFYGSGSFAPAGACEIAYQGMPALLARYETFVFLPTSLEPFGRAVAEAWAAGCALVVNDLVGAKYWITEHPDALATAGGDFWDCVLDA